ncbi:porin family protein [Tellurirhabdus rosea]|uniref:porin family protein n=1 Tax=Tellurirhabdus rosea TaxID=2674997 RepID=UPI002251DC35|nr:porin family protein [Tellurirhabdus rosea]
MKKILWLLWLLPALSMAQPIKFGVKFGANFSQLQTDGLRATRLDNGSPVMTGGQAVVDFFKESESRRTGFVGGVYARLGKKLYIQPEVLVSAKGGSFDIVRTGMTSTTQRVDIKTTTIDIPLMVGYKLGPLRLNAGPLASLPISESKSFKDAVNQYTTQPVDQTYKQAIFGYQAGAGLSLLGLQLDVRYEGGLSDLSRVGIKTPQNDSRFTTRGNLWQITAGFGF